MRGGAVTPRHHIGAQLSAITAIASELVPCPSESPERAKLWRTCVAYSNERLLGDELDELCAEEKRQQAAEDERLSRQLRWLGLPRWLERWSA